MPVPHKEAPTEKQLPTFPCSICGRQFIQNSLSKHEKACQKLSTLNRKVFDAGKQRATGSDITINDVRRVQKEIKQAGGTFSRPKTNWRERHEDFIEAIAASKKVDLAIKTGAPLPPPPKSKVPSDFIQCEYCGRNFNSTAAERHIPFCRDQQARQGGSVKIPSATSSRPLPSQRVASAIHQATIHKEHKNGAHPLPLAQSAAVPGTRAGGRSKSPQKPLTTSDHHKPPTAAAVKIDTKPRASATSATADRSSYLPKPVSRSNSAPRNPAGQQQPQRNVLKTPTPVQQRKKR